MAKVSVIIPTKNEEKNIERCLASIKKQTYRNLEIIVVDNQSKDKTVELARKYAPKIFAKGPERSAQRNFGAQKSAGEILFFVDADMELDKNVISQALEVLEKDAKTKGVIVPETSVGKNYWANVRALERSCYLGEPMIEAARIFEKKAFLRAGGFDETLVAAEDWDLHQRIKNLGKIARIEAKITHCEGTLSLTRHLKKKYYYAKKIHLYAQKHPEHFKTQSSTARIKIFAKNWQKLARDPIHGLGVFILKSIEYLTYLFSKL